jgi:hypothetical protein
MNSTVLRIIFIWTITFATISSQYPDTQTIVVDISDNSNRFSSFEEKMFDTKTISDELILMSGNNNLGFLEEALKSNTRCESRTNADKGDFYYFLPIIKGIVRKEDEGENFSSGCFESNSYVLEKLTREETIISITSSGSKSFLCSDFYWLATSNIHQIVTVVAKGKHRVVLKNLSQDDLDEIRVSGFRLLSFCQGFFTTLHSLFKSLKMYLGGIGKDPSSWIFNPHVPDYMVKANIDFLERYAHFKPAFRGENGKRVLDIDEKEIKSGDFIAIYRLDGLDPLIMFGSGSRLGHSAVACWIEGELFVLESQDGWYWPRNGIQKNKWKTWLQWANNADFNVAILPLKDEIRQKFNVEKALAWYNNGIEGLNYGYHNFLYSWIDTAEENLPKDLIQSTILLPVFSIFERITKPLFNKIMGESLNQRLQTKNLSISQAAAEAGRRNISFEELLAMPEIEGWEYSDGKNYVCSCFVIAFLKEGGAFDDLEILSTEFTPKDVYQLNIWDRSYKNNRPQICKDADPELEYCQIMGKYQVKLDGYSSIAPYSHMNEKCPSIAPEYTRPEDC